MRLIWIFALCAVPLLLSRGEDITTTKGETYKSVTISRTEPDGIVVVSKTGIVKLPFTELSEEVQRKYGYNAEKAAQYSATQSEHQRQAEQASSEARSAAAQQKVSEFAKTERLNQERAAQRARHQAAADKVAAITPKEVYEVRISQALDDGALAYIGNSDEPVFLRGFTNAVDGDRYYNQSLYQCGVYRYQTTMGAAKTIHAYTTSAAAAVAYFESVSR
jgi:hypothetical protein